MKNKRYGIIFALVSVLFVISLVLYFVFFSKPGAKLPEAYTVTEKEIQPVITSSANIYPYQYDSLTFPVSGKIVSVNASPGDVLKKGDIIAKLENDELKTALKNAKLNLDQATTRKKQTDLMNETQVKQLDIQLKDAQNNLQTLQKYISELKERIKETEEAVKLNPTPELLAQMEELISQLKSTEEKYNQAKSAYEQLKINYDGAVQRRNLDLKIASLQVDQAATGYSSQQKSIDKLNLIAPYDCIVLKYDLKEGQDYQPAAQAGSNIFSSASSAGSVIIAPVDWQPYASFTLDQMDVSRVKAGDPVEAILDVFPDMVLKGKIISKSLYPEASSENIILYKAEAVFENKPSQLYSGMSCLIRILLPKEKGLAVPVTSIRYINGKPYVYLIKSDGSITKRRVKTSTSDDSFTIILSGVKKGEKIVKNVGTLFKQNPSLREAFD